MTHGLRALDLGNDDSGQPKYERLKNHLIAEMVAGRLKPGHALPSEHQLAQTLGVARMTIRQAMVALENDGLIRRVQGKGNFVEENVQQKLKQGLDIFALVVPETHGGFYPSLLRGFESAAGECHHQTIIAATDDDVDRQASVILQLMDKKVGGVAINPTGHCLTPAYQVRQLQEHGIPVVFCHRGVEGIVAPLLAIPFREIGKLAGKVLSEHGHRRVAFFTVHPQPSVMVQQEGLLEGLRTSDGDVSIQSVYVASSMIALQEDAVWVSLQKTFAQPNPPTAIFASFDSMAEMIYLLLPKLGLRVPEDVSLLGFGGAWRDGALRRRMTSVVIDEIATGQKAVSLLHDMRCGNRPIYDNAEIILDLGLSDGETLSSPPQTEVPVHSVSEK
jgi:DNA-binding LacI/PurR family transcriptional regulator